MLNQIKLALVGKNISHSRSQEMYEKILNQNIDYTLIDIQNIDDLPPLGVLQNLYQGISITAPYKGAYLRNVKTSKNISSLGAINVINLSDFSATNTDYMAIEDLFQKYFSEKKIDRIAILGNGAMSRVVQHYLKRQKKYNNVFSRATYGDISHIDLVDYDLVINCCSRDFVYSGKMNSSSIFWDMNYSSSTQAEMIQNNNVEYIDGLSLLEKQAFFALEFLNII